MKSLKRSELIDKIGQLTDTQRIQKSASVLSNLFLIEGFWENESFFVYVSKSDEVDTYVLMKEILKRGKKLYIPKIVGENLGMVMIDDLDGLVVGKYGIHEPISNDFHYGGVDVGIIPGLGFGYDRSRLGRGGGYYDRFMGKAMLKKKIGICFHEQLINDVPLETHDIQMDILVTDKIVI